MKTIREHLKSLGPLGWELLQEALISERDVDSCVEYASQAIMKVSWTRAAKFAGRNSEQPYHDLRHKLLTEEQFSGSVPDEQVPFPFSLAAGAASKLKTNNKLLLLV